jgi:hypothetical protein
VQMETAYERRLRLAKDKRLELRVKRRFKRFQNEFEEMQALAKSRVSVNNSQERQNEHKPGHTSDLNEINEVKSKFYNVPNDMKYENGSEFPSEFSLDSISDINSGVSLSKNNVNRLINKDAELFNMSLWKGFFDSLLIFVQVVGFVFAMLLIVGLYLVIWLVFRVVVGF